MQMIRALVAGTAMAVLACGHVAQAQPDDHATEPARSGNAPIMASAADTDLTPASILAAQKARRQRLEEIASQYLHQARQLVAKAAEKRTEDGYVEARDFLVLAEEALTHASLSKPSVQQLLNQVRQQLTTTFTSWAETLLVLGDARAKAKEFDAAIAYYQRAAALAPDTAEVTSGRITKAKAAAARIAFEKQVKAGTL